MNLYTDDQVTRNVRYILVLKKFDMYIKCLIKLTKNVHFQGKTLPHLSCTLKTWRATIY